MGEIRQLAVELREKELDLSKSRQFERRVSELEAELLQASSDIDFSHGLSHTQSIEQSDIDFCAVPAGESRCA